MFKDAQEGRSRRMENDVMKKTIEVEIVEKGEWDESLHPRDDHGRFGSGGGGAKPSGSKEVRLSLKGRIMDIMGSLDVPMQPAAEARQERTAEASATKLGLYKPEKTYTIGTPVLAQGLRDAFGAGLQTGPNADTTAWLRAEEIQEARLASGEDSAYADLRRMGHAAEPDNISARNNAIREAAADHGLGRTWQELHETRDVTVSGQEYRDALKVAYAEGVRAHMVVRANSENIRLKDPTRSPGNVAEREREHRAVRSPAGRGSTPVDPRSPMVTPDQVRASSLPQRNPASWKLHGSKKKKP